MADLDHGDTGRVDRRGVGVDLPGIQLVPHLGHAYTTLAADVQGGSANAYDYANADPVNQF
ncbi:hypothetical protein ACWDRX_27580, partial [Streptomyces nigra]